MKNVGKLIPGENDLETLCIRNHMEDVLESWDKNRNLPLTPSEVSFRSGVKVWWKCPVCGTNWESKVASRTNGHGCPNCAIKKTQEKRLQTIAKANNFKQNWPEFAKEWDYEKNGDLKPEDFSSSSTAKVWWKCDKGHEWVQSINSRTNYKSKCPVCNRSGRVVKGLNDFGTLYPQYAKEWNYERNSLTPFDYTSSSSEKVWWKCEKGHEWKQPIVSRTSIEHSICPICSNRKLLKGYNDLQSQCPELLKEWDYNANEDDPSEIRIKSQKKVGWICANCGNHFEQRVIDRVYKNTGCPKCGLEKQKENFRKSLLSNRMSLADRRPDLLGEWDYEKNHGINPKEILPGSKEKAWWTCKYGHSYYASISNRVKGAGCPICNLKATTSFPEQCVYYYVKRAFGDTVNEYRYKRKIYDVFIPSLNVAIEYDGYKWHQDDRDTKNDEEKNRICIENGISLYRIREEGSSQISSDGIVVISCIYKDEQSLQSAIEKLLRMLGAFVSVSIERDRLDIQKQYYSHLDEQSLANRFPAIADEWNYERNGSILPSMVHFGTMQKYWWRCKEGHEWKTSVNSRTQYGRGCPYCKGTRVLKGYNDLLTTDPELSKEWNYEKNGTLTPDQVMRNSNKSVWWKCSICGNEWESRINRRVSGAGCRKCNQNYVSEVEKSRLQCFPSIAAEWDYEKNGLIQPSMVPINSKKPYWWKCKNGHNWKASANSRTKNGRGCPYCEGISVLKGYNDLLTTDPEVAKEWDYEKNQPLTPDQVMRNSDKTVWWKCSKCGNEWTTRISRRTSGSKCRKCTAKESSKSKQKAVKCVETGVVYQSLKAAEEETGANRTAIIRCCKGTQKTAGKYHWEYI